MAIWLAALALLVPSRMSAMTNTRESLLRTAQAYWQLSDGGKSASSPLTCVGTCVPDIPAEGKDALPGSRAIRLTDAYFDAGRDLTVRGDRITVYLRARDPRGQWTYALFNKRGGHDVVTFNLFSVVLSEATGPVIGFELHSRAGFVMVSFPISRIDPTAWHDLVGRYDGKTLALICDGKVMAQQRWRGGDLTQNTEPTLIGAETDQGRVVRPFTGEMQEAALWSRALSDRELARLMRKERLVPDPAYVEPYHSPIHYRPEIGRLADTIPFYWKGEYHIFYLRALDKVPWEHIVSRDLVHWKELPTALVADGAPDSPDGLHMFTGSVIERNGTFHIFYTGWNPDNPRGREFIMHATSPDLIHWTKHPEDILGPDGVHYADHHDRDFRDAFVFWNENEGRYWMLLCADDAKTKAMVVGVAVSNDLTHWELEAPLANVPGQECPDFFRIGDTCYLIGGEVYRWAKDPRGPYHEAVSPGIDRPFIYAAKRMFDGRRHVWTGWLWDRVPEEDHGAPQWGGTQCLPRELYAGPDGQLFSRPVPEVTAVFRHTVLDLAAKPSLSPADTAWQYRENALVGTTAAKTETHGAFATPPNYLLQCRVRLDPNAELALVLREQAATGDGYRLTLRPAQQEAEIAGPGFHYPHKILLDTGQPITIQAFVQGSMIECFINDAFAFSCRAYNYAQGRLGVNVTGGTATISALSVKTP